MVPTIVFISGMSGAGKSTVLNFLEDRGFFCVDNLPIDLMDRFVAFMLEGDEGKISRVALVVDIRSGKYLRDIEHVFGELKARNVDYRLLYLDADDATLIKRYKETRRTHPLAKGGRIEEGIDRERERTGFLKKEADYVIDTSQLLTRDLKAQIERIFIENQDFKSLMITILSFGFKYGMPQDSDLVFDVRFLPNPYYIPELKPLTGLDPRVSEFVMKSELSRKFSDKLTDMIRFLIPNYIREGKNQLVISIGCTGGKHRSVVLAEELYRRLLEHSEDYGVRVEHRDAERKR